MNRAAPLALALLALPGRVLLAGDPILGGQLTLALPQGDLNGGKWMHGRTGLGAGLHCLVDLDGGHALNLRGDWTAIREGQVNLIASDGSVQLFAEQAKVRILALGVDYNFYFSSNPVEGPYFLVGLGQSWFRSSGASQVPGGIGGPIAWPSSHGGSALQYALGAGHKLRPHLGWEFRFTQANYGRPGIDGASLKTPMFNLSLNLDY